METQRTGRIDRPFVLQLGRHHRQPRAIGNGKGSVRRQRPGAVPAMQQAGHRSANRQRRRADQDEDGFLHGRFAAFSCWCQMQNQASRHKPPAIICRQQSVSVFQSLHDDAGIGAAKAEAVVKGCTHLALLGHVGDQSDAFSALVRIVQIEGRGHDLIADGQNAEDRLHRARAAQQVTDRALGRGHRDIADSIAEQTL
ncbi:hypothetical protein E4T56_gene15042, partial [Termitomyces sp. T112]